MKASAVLFFILSVLMLISLSLMKFSASWAFGAADLKDILF